MVVNSYLSLDSPDKTALAVTHEAPLQITLLGEFYMRKGEQAVSLKTPSYQSLLAYLVIHGQQVHSRQKLAFQFWPDSGEAQARTNLRKALYNLRHTLPDADCLLAADRQTVQWLVEAPCVVDVWEFEAAVARAEQTDDPRDREGCLQQAIDAYRGEFMPGHYDDWVLAAREKLRQQYVASLEELLLLNEEQRQYLSAITLAKKLLRQDPLHEAACRRLMRLHSLAGNRAGALRTYHTFSTRLQRELGVNPNPATQEVYERLLNLPDVPTPLTPARLPLVAREEAWRNLQSTWKQCFHRLPGAVLLEGEAGIGKTRLAEELLDWAEKQGIVVLTAECYPSQNQLAYAPVANWLRSENLQTVFRHLDKKSLVECSRLLPEISSRHPDLPTPSPFSESWQRHHFFSVLTQTVLQLRQPFLLFIDDLQWCDQDSLDWLIFLLHHDPQARFLLMGAVRSEEITPDHPLTTWQPQLERASRLTNISLERLDAGNTAQLAGHVLEQELDSQQAEYLHIETEGNPLFVVELARVGLPPQLYGSRSLTLPPKLQVIIETRLTSLSSRALELAQLASVIGNSFTYDLLNQACTQDEDMVIHGLDELWQRRIVRERGVEAYDFSHDKIRQGAYESLSPIRRRQIHQQVWRALETLYADNIDPVSGQIARHCEASAQYQDAITYYQRAAKVAQAVYANADTEKYLRGIVSLFSKAKTKPERQIEIYQQLEVVLRYTGRYGEAAQTLQTAIAQTTDAWTLCGLYQSMANVYQPLRMYDEAHHMLDKAEAALERAPQTSPERWWREWIETQAYRISLFYFCNQISDMATLSDEVGPIVKKYGSRFQIVDFYEELVLLRFRQERGVLSDEAVDFAKKAYEALEEGDELHLIAGSRMLLAFAYLHQGWHGNLDEAESHFLAVLEMAEEMGNLLSRTRCLNFLLFLNRMRGDQEQVRALVPQLMSSAEEGDLQEYIAMAEANLAWLKWLEGNMDATKTHGQKALAAWQSMAFVMPVQWVALWPLLDTALIEDELAEAVEYAEVLLRPELSRLPDELTAVLRQAIEAYTSSQMDITRGCLQTALQNAREINQL